jgi:hypothetical protein
MNKHYILSLFDPNLKTVGVAFKGGSQLYTYKTYDDFAVGDLAVVHTPSNGFQVVEVKALHGTPDIDADSRVDYKWIVQKVDLKAYEQLEKKDEEMSAKVKEAQRDAHRKSAREALLAKVPSLGILDTAPPTANLTLLANGLAVDSMGGVFHPSAVGGWVGPFDSVKEAMSVWKPTGTATPTVHDV